LLSLEGVVIGFHEVGTLEAGGAPFTPSAGCTPIVAPKTYNKTKSGNLPVGVDWRKKNVFSPIKNQGPCGQCWSYAIIGALEATAAQFVNSGKVVKYSTQQLVDCVNEGQCIDGQWPGPTLDYIISCGINTDAEYPPSLQCGSLCTPKRAPASQKLWPFYDIIPNELAMVDASSKSPGIVFIMYIVGNSFQDHGMLPNRDKVYNPKTCVCNNCDTHLMQIVGYGVGTKGEDKGLQYWWVRNSWSARWGDKGYVKIVRGRGICGLDKGGWLIRTGVNGG